MKKKTVAALTLLLIFVPLLVLAQGGGGTPPGQFTNPLGDINDLAGFLQAIIRWLLGTVALFAMVALVWGGLQMILALGDESKVKNAKRTIFWAIVGFMVAGLSYAILVTVRGFLISE